MSSRVTGVVLIYALFAAGLATQAGISFNQAAIDAVHANIR